MLSRCRMRCRLCARLQVRHKARTMLAGGCTSTQLIRRGAPSLAERDMQLRLRQRAALARCGSLGGGLPSFKQATTSPTGQLIVRDCLCDATAKILAFAQQPRDAGDGRALSILALRAGHQVLHCSGTMCPPTR